MAHKQIKFDVDARKALEEGVDAVANAVKAAAAEAADTPHDAERGGELGDAEEGEYGGGVDE